MASASKSSSLIVKRLYRNLLRAATPYTSPSPNARVLNCFLHRTGADDEIGDWEAFIEADKDIRNKDELARDLTITYAPQGRDESEKSSVRTYKRLFRRLLREVVTGQNGIRKSLFPSQVDTKRLREVIRREFRDGPAAQSKHFDVDERKEAAFTALRELNKKLSYFEELEESAPKYTKQQAASHVSSLPLKPAESYLRPGAFLISHPYMIDSFFAKTIICILEDRSSPDEREAKRSSLPGQTFGLIINRVSISPQTGKNKTLEEAFEKDMLPARLADVFGDSLVREGGPVDGSIQMLHAKTSDQEDDISSKIGGKLIPSIPEDDDTSTALFSDRATYFQGDIMRAMAAVDRGSLDRDDVAFFVGGSTWAPGQLEHEIDQGFWIPCRGPPEMALTGICEHEISNSSQRPLADLWLSMMSACGEDEGKLAHLFFHEEWHENGLACDSFDEDEEFDVEFLL